jgi:hypothetical protein
VLEHPVEVAPLERAIALGKRGIRRRAAAEPEPEEQEPEQDDTDSSVLDTEEHSDAPGPFGTG